MTESQQTHWVGIGASAGGLEALRAIAKNLIPGTNAIYVIVQHMSPQHKSLLTSLIGRETDLDVYEITDDVAPVPNTIYVTPSNYDVVVKAGRLRLLEPSKEIASPKPSVDRFFKSLAEDRGKYAIGIVISGTGSDGTYGADAIRASGGYVIAQSEQSAKYSGMPASVIKSDVVDRILIPEEMGLHIAQLAAGGVPVVVPDEMKSGDPVAKIMKVLHLHGKVDFSEYKPSTIRRRMERRITALGLEDLNAYADYLQTDPQEVGLLFKDMLISVTSFFRDPNEFAALGTQVKSLLLDCKGKVLRVWVPGCATGEEAFSVAILLLEELGGIDALDETQLQIFATDIDVEALTVARRGFYPAVALEDVPADLRKKYFTRSGGGYTIHPAIRDCVIFTNHNVCEDPPFSNIDLITCRNLLIYFGQQLQSRVMERLHYALNPNGLLLFGKSESGPAELFRQITSDAKVYRRRTRIDQRRANVAQLISKSRRTTDSQMSEEYRQSLGILQSMFDALVRAVGPDCLLVTSDFQIKRVYGNVDQFISLSEGDVRSVNIGIIRHQFRHEVRTLTTLALRDGEPRFGHERNAEDNPSVCVQIAVYPLPPANGAEELAVVAFRQWNVEIDADAELEGPEGDATPAQVMALERELHITRNSLQQTVEELETTNEELQALNEELQSGNEELQSTNEELETANEELQSTNEELITVNEELQINSQELSLINQELDSILANIPAPTLVVDSGLHIIRCSESARSMFQIDGSLGRPHLSQCSVPANFPDMTKMVAEVIRVGNRSEESFQTDTCHGKIIAAPYFSPKGELIGATAIISEGVDQSTTDDLTDLLDGIPGMVWQKGLDNQIVKVNRTAADFMGIEPDDAVGASMNDFVPFLVRDDANDAAIVETMKPVLSRRERSTLEDGTTIWHMVSRVPFRSGSASGLYVIASDISEEYRATIDQRHRNGIAELALNASPVGLEYVDINGVLQLQNPAAEAFDGTQSVGSDWAPDAREDLMIDPETSVPVDLDHHPIIRGLRGEVFAGEIVLRVGNDGSETMEWVHGAPVRGDDGEVIGAVGTTLQMPGYRAFETVSDVDGTGHSGLNILDWNTLSGDLVLSPALTEFLRQADLTPPEVFSEFRDLIQSEDADRFDQAIDAHLNDRDRFFCAFRLARAEQDDLWIEARGQAVWAIDGAPTHFIMTLTDVSATWSERLEVNRRSALADMAEETGGLAVWRLDLAKMRVVLSESAALTMGVTANGDEISLDGLLSSIHKEDRAMVRHGIRGVADEAVPFSSMVRLDLPDDDGTVLQISGRAERDPGGTVISVIGIVRELESNRRSGEERLPQTTAAE